MYNLKNRDIAKELSYKRGYRIHEAIDIVDDVMSIIKKMLLEGNCVTISNLFKLQVFDTKLGIHLHLKKARSFSAEAREQKAKGVHFESKPTRRGNY